MKKKMICIGCPMGCELNVEIENNKAVSVEGNNCGIGAKYAVEEIEAPKRMVTSTVISNIGIPVPVKTREAVPKDKIFDVICEIKRAVVLLPVRIGDVIISNVSNTGVSVVVTKSVLLK